MLLLLHVQEAAVRPRSRRFHAVHYPVEQGCPLVGGGHQRIVSGRIISTPVHAKQALFVYAGRVKGGCQRSRPVCGVVHCPEVMTVGTGGGGGAGGGFGHNSRLHGAHRAAHGYGDALKVFGRVSAGEACQRCCGRAACERLEDSWGELRSALLPVGGGEGKAVAPVVQVVPAGGNRGAGVDAGYAIVFDGGVAVKQVAGEGCRACVLVDGAAAPGAGVAVEGAALCAQRSGAVYGAAHRREAVRCAASAQDARLQVYAAAAAVADGGAAVRCPSVGKVQAADANAFSRRVDSHYPVLFVARHPDAVSADVKVGCNGNGWEHAGQHNGVARKQRRKVDEGSFLFVQVAGPGVCPGNSCVEAAIAGVVGFVGHHNPALHGARRAAQGEGVAVKVFGGVSGRQRGGEAPVGGAAHLRLKVCCVKRYVANLQVARCGRKPGAVHVVQVVSAGGYLTLSVGVPHVAFLVRCGCVSPKNASGNGEVSGSVVEYGSPRGPRAVVVKGAALHAESSGVVQGASTIYDR